MYNSVKTATIGALFHDIGKVVHRAGIIDGRAHSISGTEWMKQFCQDQEILDCIRFHHHQDIQHAKIKKDHIAYAVYLADNISSGLDRREIEGEGAKGFDKGRCLESVYNLLHNRSEKAVYNVASIKSQINYPHEADSRSIATDYVSILTGVGESLSGINFTDQYVNSLLELCEAYLSYIPASTYLGEVADISLFDHSKIAGALAAAIVLYLEGQGRTNYQRELFEKRNDFYQEKAFALFSFDISGIQQFIYTISSKGALKGLRTRSFYLEILLENLADEILSVFSLSRANLLYTGGGHAYILLPNTSEGKSLAKEVLSNINQRLMEHFGARLFIASGYQECSANELMSKTDDPESYSNIFRSVASQIAEEKLHRYSGADLKRLNQTSMDQTGRECAVCGVSAHLTKWGEEFICQNCAAFNDISGLIIKKEIVFVVTKEKMDAPFLPLFSAQGEALYLYAFSVERTKKLLQKDSSKIIRIYSKNTFRTGLSLASKLWFGDYAAKNADGALKTFSELADSSAGIKRIGVLRADVDNLGTTFISGFQRASVADKYRYVTISRTTTLSRSMSIFFKYYLNNLIEISEDCLLSKEGARNIVIVYAGGDDLFFVGAWDEVLSTAIHLRKAFAKYTGGALTLSAGLGVFQSGYPISRMAAETAELENKAKKNQHQNGIKNSISLFGLEVEKECIRDQHNCGCDNFIEDKNASPMSTYLKDQHTYDWDTFENKVMGEKYAAIKSIFAYEADYGNSFLYNILALLRQTKEDYINIARLAYLLARREPKRDAPKEVKEAYADFTGKIYQWALDEEERRQLITALIIYTYSRRDEKEENKDE